MPITVPSIYTKIDDYNDGHCSISNMDELLGKVYVKNGSKILSSNGGTLHSSYYFFQYLILQQKYWWKGCVI